MDFLYCNNHIKLISVMNPPESQFSYIHTLFLLPALLLNCNDLLSLSIGAAAYKSPSKNNRDTSHENEQTHSIIEHISVKMHWRANSTITHDLILLRKPASMSHIFKPTKKHGLVMQEAALHYTYLL